jgi:hypothetical protein
MLEVVNPATQNLAVHLKLELLDPQDYAEGRAIRDVALQPGVNKLTIPLNFTAAQLNKDEDEDLLWYRLRYRIDPSPDVTSAPDATSGVISLSEIDTPDIFVLEVGSPAETHRGARHYTHVRALHPITAKPVKDVSVNVEFKLDSTPEQTLRGSAVTDAEGYALISLSIPNKIDADEGDLKVVARHGGFVKEATKYIELNDNARIMVTTDKPIYQPGQPLHVRTLMFDAANHAAANAIATLKITDPENTTVFQKELTASRFGVANADWTIPENTRLGNYDIRVEVDDGNYDDSSGYAAVKISRYDLPNFTVSVKPDRPYYLSQQDAVVEVKADYLFGQPVKRGHVRVVREQERKWNYREQKWDIKEGENYEGETDDSGRFVAHVKLQADHKELADLDYSRFEDLTYSAYFTDPTTNRTEPRKFDLRVTKDAIHIYVSEGRYRQARGFPLEFFIATAYADGTPVSCDVTMNEVDPEHHDLGPVLRTIRTNKYGIAKISGLMLADKDSSSLRITAQNAGAVGHHTESFYYSERPVIRVATERPLYRAGEPIKVNITASEPELKLFVDVMRDSSIIESRSVTLANGAASFTLRYRPEFRDEVTISAFSKVTTDSDDYDFSYGSRTVLFPRDRDLKLNLRWNQVDYKPGDDATVDFRILTADGKPAMSALGVVIFDRAVEERARTDQDFGGRFGFYGSFSSWRGYDDQVGGVTRKELQRIDLKQPLPEGMDLVAELLLEANYTRPEFFSTEGFAADHAAVFSKLTGLNLKPSNDILESQYKNGGIYPKDIDTLRRILFEAGVDADRLRDPWGTPYTRVFSIDKDDSVLEVVSAGPDKIFTTKDDFTVKRITRPYFRFTGEAIDRAVARFHSRSGGFIRDAATLKNELQSEGIDVGSLRDPWGQPYDLNFTTNKDRFNLTVRSSGPDKRFQSSDFKSDDFTLWIAGIDYLTETRALVEQALGNYFRATNALPANDAQLRQALTNVDQSRLQDPWGNRYYAVYKVTSRYSDLASLRTVATYGQPLKARTEITPVTQEITSMTLRSNGADGNEGTADDFDAATFSQLTAEESSHGRTSMPATQQVFFSGAKGAIRGTVTDPNGGVIAGAKVKATLKTGSQEFETETDDAGKFLLRNLPVGLYTVHCEYVGFSALVMTEVPVSSSNITTVDLILQLGTVGATVNITAGPGASVDTTQNTTGTNVTTEQRTAVYFGKPAQLSTPRLREYFPETLVWQPSLETDQQGRAQLKFKFADNITTWKMSVIGSTEDGELGSAEAEIKSFQPFFVEHDPPRVLTEGDQISLPVVLRNYLERAQTVDLEIKPESWFELQGSAHQKANVPAGDAARQTFDLKAVASIKDGKQRITARSSEASDAIEKPVTVHPDGEEKTQTTSDVFAADATLNIDLPVSVIPGSMQGELKIYPSLMAHVVESMEGILERPHGCGEQTISSTYPSVLFLRRNKLLANESQLGRKAQRYAELGYQRLLNYRSEDGGFTYWGRGDADFALTAYALRFLQDAREFVSVDDDVISGARTWLIKRQQANGSWLAHSYVSDQADTGRRTTLLTAYVARVLAMTESRQAIDKAAAAKTPAVTNVSPELRQALAYLATRIDEIDEPYLIASYALAAIDAGDQPTAARATTKLRALAHAEGDTTYWALETNTPFYGWGLAGRIETTALAVQALTRYANTQAPETNGTTEPLVRSGLLFLLRAKDRYGVWYSTQATINVLDALLTLLAEDAGSADQTKATAVEIIVNGTPATSLSLPPGEQSTALLRADISRFLRGGTNRIELRRASGSSLASIQLVANYYVPWLETAPAQTAQQGSVGASALRLTTTFDKTTARINEEISCHVRAERVGHSGYGMLLAEIGLPPGAEVDRASLETAMKGSDWSFSQYDILPDRVVVYLWPRAGGIDFAFKFRPRFALNAKAAPAIVYDYYNPDARVVVAPASFVVK